jgi:hypothetical protein
MCVGNVSRYQGAIKSQSTKDIQQQWPKKKDKGINTSLENTTQNK